MNAGSDPAYAQAIDPGVRIGHVHLKVADLDRALRFYRDILGFTVTQHFGPQAAFLSAGGYHHHIGLNTWESRGGSPPPRQATGLCHVAILYPTRRAGFWPEAFPSMARRITASGKRSICAILTRTVSNSTGIAPQPSGRATSTDSWR